MGSKHGLYHFKTVLVERVLFHNTELQKTMKMKGCQEDVKMISYWRKKEIIKMENQMWRRERSMCHSHSCYSRALLCVCFLFLVFLLPAGGGAAMQLRHTSFLLSLNYLPCINTYFSSPFFAR